MAVQSRIVLEPSAQGIVDATSMPPFLYELEPTAARKVLDDLQAAPVDKLPVEEEWITVPADVGDARVRIIRPVGSAEVLPVIVYMHGGGWILGNAATHDRLVRELAVGARAALLFVEYPNAPEPVTRWRSSRATRRLNGSCARARPRALTPAGWPWPASRSAATWPPRSPSWPRSAAT
jgi:hypothetical protein